MLIFLISESSYARFKFQISTFWNVCFAKSAIALITILASNLLFKVRKVVACFKR